MKEVIKSTTIIGIRKDNLVVVAGDGQASFGNTIMKANVKKKDEVEIEMKMILKNQNIEHIISDKIKIE